MKNKLLVKYLLSHYICSVFFLGLAAGTTAMLKEFQTMDKKDFANFSVLKSPEIINMICLMLIVVSVFMSGLEAIYVPSQAHKTTIEITREYLAQLFDKNPSLKQYEYILKDEKSLKDFAAIICNGLSKEEHIHILNIVNNIFSGSERSDYEEYAKIKMAHLKVLDIIQEHTKKHPEYIQQILYTLENQRKTLVLPLNTRTR